MTDEARQMAFLSVCALIALLCLLSGLWVFWLSSSLHLLATGLAMLLLTGITAFWWKIRVTTPE